jgi:ADP-heptose:LPS heptosyltransferase
MHLAAVIGTPTMAIFDPSAPFRTVPLGDGRKALCRDFECTHGTMRRRPREYEGCTRDVSVGKVEKVFMRVLTRAQDR